MTPRSWLIVGHGSVGSSMAHRIDAAGDRVQVMRGEQAFETWPMKGALPRAVGGGKKPLPRVATIVSKERYAHAERGKSEVTGGRLDWEPPQVGTSARATLMNRAGEGSGPRILR